MIIVTGGAGFIGSVLLQHLNKQGISDILVVDSLRCGDKWKNLRAKKYIDYIHKNDFLAKLSNNEYKDIEAIVHLGACSATTELDADYLIENNYRYTKTLIDWSVAHNIRFIYASSAATYGDGLQGFNDDTTLLPQLLPLNMYGYSKQMIDEYVMLNNLENKVAGLKFFNVFGPNENHKGSMKSMVYRAFYQVKKSGQINLFSSDRSDYADGEQKRDFIYVKDVAHIIFRLIQEKKICGIFNLGTGIAKSWNDLARAVFKALKLPENINYIEMPASLKGRYQYYTKAEMSKLKKYLPGLIFRNLDEAVADYVINHLESKKYC